MKVRFGVGLGADTAPDELAAIVDHLEATGVDSLWFSELVYSKAVDPFIGMAHALARTTNLKVGTSVAVLPGRHPVLVAKQLASLAGLAPKRVLPVFGLRSAIPAERDIFVVPEGERAAVFDESLRLLRSVLEQDDVSFAGDYFSVSSVAVAPRPVKPLDIWLGGSAPGRVSAGSAGWATAGWAASSPRPKPAAAASRSSRRRTRPAARSKRTISASISPSATANCRTRLAAAVRRRRPDIDPDAADLGGLVTSSSAARRLPRSGTDQVRHPAGRAAPHCGLHRPVRGRTSPAAELTSS